jgi:WD40 repeat protein
MANTFFALTFTLFAHVATAGTFPTLQGNLGAHLNAFSESFSLLNGDGRIATFRTATGEPIQQSVLTPLPLTPASSVFSPDGKLVASLDHNYLRTIVTVYESSSGHLLKSIQLPTGERVYFVTNDLLAISHSPSASEIAPLTIRVLEWRSEKILKSLSWEYTSGQSYFTGAAVSADGRFLGASRYIDSNIRVWDLRSGATYLDIQAPEHAARFPEIAFFGKDKVAVSFTVYLGNQAYNQVLIYNLANRSLEDRIQLSNENRGYSALTGSPDGTRLALFDLEHRDLNVFTLANHTRATFGFHTWCEYVSLALSDRALVAVCRDTGAAESITFTTRIRHSGSH